MTHSLDPQPLRAARAGLPPATPAWVTPELVEKTVRFWSERSGILVSSDEAIGIILRVGTLIDVLNRR